MWTFIDIPSVFLRKALLVAASVLALVATSVAFAPPASAAPPAPPSVCQVTYAESGGFAFWQQSPGATSYVYAIRYDNGPERYTTTTDFSAFFPIQNGIATAMRVVAFNADGNSGNTFCAIDTTNAGDPNNPPGGGDGGGGGNGSGCSLSTVSGGVSADWADVSGAASYVYRLEAPNQPDRYGRSTASQASIAAPAGATVSVVVSAVQPDGSYTNTVDCGSAQAGSGNLGDGGGGDGGGGGNGSGCSLSTVSGGVSADWADVSGAASYVYRLETAGQPNRYGQTSSSQAVIPATSGATVTVAVSAILGDGSYTAAVNCGSATAG